MQSFKALCRNMLDEPSFRDLFDKECHICTHTMRIFARLHGQSANTAELARSMGVSPAAIDNLEDADYCDPRLVIRLCRHLDLPVPENCPRMPRESA